MFFRSLSMYNVLDLPLHFSDIEKSIYRIVDELAKTLETYYPEKEI